MTGPSRHQTAVLVVSLGAVVAGYAATRSRRLAPVERSLSAWLRRPLGPTADRLMTAATDLGSMFAVAGVSVVLTATGHRRRAGEVFVAAAGGYWTAQAGKALVGRPRPYQTDEADRRILAPSGTAWPSAHPAVVAAELTVLSTDLPAGLRLTGWLLGVFVAYSRVYVGVHHPTDVVSGLGLGTLCGLAVRGVRGRRFLYA